jgi:protein-L-isoaspartate(D-aspartate) O-methyltransferase
MTKDFEMQRQIMVDRQLRTRGLKDERVLAAMSSVPRHLFVPEIEKNRSYYDGPLPIGKGQTISQPYIVAYMTELLLLKGHEKVLEIGTGCGYQTAVLAEIVDHVYTIEIIAELAERAKRSLGEELQYANIDFKIGNGRKGWQEFSPFDRILLTAAPKEFPKELFSQLKDGGIVVAPVGDIIQRIVRYFKNKGAIEKEELIGVSFVPCV